MREDKITTIEHGHCCGTIITERYLANEDHNVMYWTQEVIGTGRFFTTRTFFGLNRDPGWRNFHGEKPVKGVRCQRRFQRVAPIADGHRLSIHAL